MTDPSKVVTFGGSDMGATIFSGSLSNIDYGEGVGGLKYHTSLREQTVEQYFEVVVKSLVVA